MNNMKSTILSLNFRLNKKRMQNGRIAIYLRLTIDGNRAEISTRQYIKPDCWNQARQIAIGRNIESNGINKRLSVIKADILKLYDRFNILSLRVTAESLKNEYLGVRKNEKTLNELLSFYHDRFMEKVATGQKADSTLKSIYTTKEKLKAFVKHTFKASDIGLADIEVSFISQLEHYLFTNDKLSTNSAMKYIHIFKRIIKFACDQGWLKENPTMQFRCTYSPPQRQRLTMVMRR